DTLSALAREYGTSVGTLVALNNLGSRHRIRAGQQLRLPAAGAAAPVTLAAVESPVGRPAAPVELPAEAVADAPATGSAEDLVVSAGALADDVAVAEVAEPAQTTLLSDPSDYSVAEDLTIEVHPLETLGHYADWLQIRAQRLRDINGFAFRTPVEVGRRIQLDLGRVDAQTFEGLRTAWHRQQQDAFFRDHRIAGITEHVVDSGESVWILALRKYEVPIWLFRQYNPELDLHKVRPGTRLSFPVLADNDVAS
ncbi:MAG: LysM peptidoglycan-binding domain-containing protein, partial [Woeseiaceae bacterium]